MRPARASSAGLIRRPYKNCSIQGKNRGVSPYYLARGRHTFRVRAIDRSDNVDPTPAIDKFRIVRR